VQAVRQRQHLVGRREERPWSPENRAATEHHQQPAGEQARRYNHSARSFRIDSTSFSQAAGGDRRHSHRQNGKEDHPKASWQEVDGYGGERGQSREEECNQ
jgi:hypothetical protein